MTLKAISYRTTTPQPTVSHATPRVSTCLKVMAFFLLFIQGTEARRSKPTEIEWGYPPSDSHIPKGQPGLGARDYAPASNYVKVYEDHTTPKGQVALDEEHR